MLSLSWVLVPAILKGFIDFFVAGNYKCNVAEDVADDDVVVGSFYQGRKIEKAKAKTIFPLFSFFSPQWLSNWPKLPSSWLPHYLHRARCSCFCGWGCVGCVCGCVWQCLLSARNQCDQMSWLIFLNIWSFRYNSINLSDSIKIEKDFWRLKVKD